MVRAREFLRKVTCDKSRARRQSISGDKARAPVSVPQAQWTHHAIFRARPRRTPAWRPAARCCLLPGIRLASPQVLGVLLLACRHATAPLRICESHLYDSLVLDTLCTRLTCCVRGVAQRDAGKHYASSYAAGCFQGCSRLPIVACGRYSQRTTADSDDCRFQGLPMECGGPLSLV